MLKSFPAKILVPQSVFHATLSQNKLKLDLPLNFCFLYMIFSFNSFSSNINSLLCFCFFYDTLFLKQAQVAIKNACFAKFIKKLLTWYL